MHKLPLPRIATMCEKLRIGIIASEILPVIAIVVAIKAYANSHAGEHKQYMSRIP